VVPVPLHHLRTSHPKFADSSKRDLLACLINDFCLGVRNGQSDGMLHRKTAGDVAVRHRRSLRKTVSLYNELAGSLLEFLEELVRECGPTANAEFQEIQDRKSTRLNSSHEWISYAVFCLKKKNTQRLHNHHKYQEIKF